MKEEKAEFRRCKMRDFNTVCSELEKHLRLCGEIDGKIYWYEGTIELLFELMGYLVKEEGSE